MRFGVIVFGAVFCVIAGAARLARADDQDRLVQIQQLIEHGDLPMARARALDALRSSPEDPRLRNFLGVIDAREQNFAAAESNFQRAIQQAPRFTGAYLNLGRLYQEQAGGVPGALSRALAVYRLLLKVEPGNVEAHYQCALLLFRLHEFAESLRELQLLPSPAQHRAAALALFCGDHAGLPHAREAAAAAAELADAGDFTEADLLPILPVLDRHQRQVAEQLLEALARRGLASPDALDRLTALYVESGQWKQARANLEHRMQMLGRPSADLLLQLGRVAYQAGDLEGALGYLAHARDLEPRNALAHYLFGLICIDLKLPPEARQSLGEAVRLDPENAFSHYALGAVLLQEKKADEAIPHFQKFLERRPADPRGRFALGVAYFDAYRMDDARGEFRAAAASPVTRSGAYLYLGRLALREDHLEEAENDLRSAVQASPSEPAAYADLGLVQIRRHEYQVAAQTLSRAVRIAPGHYQSNLNLLMLYQRTKDPRAAEQERRVARLQQSAEDRERLLLRSLDIRPY